MHRSIIWFNNFIQVIELRFQSFSAAFPLFLPRLHSSSSTRSHFFGALDPHFRPIGSLQNWSVLWGAAFNNWLAADLFARNRFFYKIVKDLKPDIMRSLKKTFSLASLVCADLQEFTQTGSFTEAFNDGLNYRFIPEKVGRDLTRSIEELAAALFRLARGVRIPEHMSALHQGRVSLPGWEERQRDGFFMMLCTRTFLRRQIRIKPVTGFSVIRQILPFTGCRKDEFSCGVKNL
jgi:hypothetical protein